MDYDKVKTEDLPKTLIEKHERMLEESKRAHENIGRIRILTEKLDQISHWVEDSKGKQKQAHMKLLDDAKDELDKLRGEATSSKINGKELEKKIKSHEEALAYWKKK